MGSNLLSVKEWAQSLVIWFLRMVVPMKDQAQFTYSAIWRRTDLNAWAQIGMRSYFKFRTTKWSAPILSRVGPFFHERAGAIAPRRAREMVVSLKIHSAN